MTKTQWTVVVLILSLFVSPALTVGLLMGLFVLYLLFGFLIVGLRIWNGGEN